jgi:hypothetical protein
MLKGLQVQIDAIQTLLNQQDVFARIKFQQIRAKIENDLAKYKYCNYLRWNFRFHCIGSKKSWRKKAADAIEELATNLTLL